MPAPSSKFERFKAMFIEECDGHIRTLEKTLEQLLMGAGGQEPLDSAFRAIHSIKGGAGMLGFERVVPFAHTFETVLDGVRRKETPASPELMAAALRATDYLSDLIAAVARGTSPPPEADAAPMAGLVTAAGLAGAPAMPAAAAGTARSGNGSRQRYTIRFQPHAGLLRRAHEPLLILRQLQELGETGIMADLARLPALRDLKPMDSYLGWTITLDTAQGEGAVREVFEFAGDDSDLAITCEPLTAGESEPALPGGGVAAPTIRVDIGRIDRLVDLAGEIAISQALVTQLIDQSLFNAHPRLFQELSQLLAHTQDLQDSVMAIRAQPIRTIFDRMPRLVRELEETTGRKIVLRMQGEDTEIDKTVIEELADPIMHMIRNAAGHGLEDAAERLAAGKPAEGLITLKAEQRGSRIVIEVSDDGRGLDRARIRDKAIARGLMAADDVLSSEDIDHLVFLPGFSTAETVTSLSGRGVGMDVVRRNIQKLGGTVAIRSEPGQGSVVVLALPLTLAVLEGMVVRAGGEAYVLPIASILECRAAWQRDARPVPGTGEVLNVRGNCLAVVHLGQVFGGAPAADPSQSIAIVTEIEGGSRIALVVDEIAGQQQVVIKCITRNLDPVPGTAGATILGDGRVALILDPAGIARLSPAGRSAASGASLPRSQAA